MNVTRIGFGKRVVTSKRDSR